MKLIECASIVVAENRQRRSFDAAALAELAESIQTKGLWHPVVLRTVGPDYVLVSGERRLRAVTQIYDLGGQFRHDGSAVFEGSIPYTLFEDLDPLAAEEAELEENIRRKDLSWQELAAATSRLQTLRSAQAKASGTPVPSTADLAKEITGAKYSGGFAEQTTRRQLVVAQHLDDPEVKAAKNVDDAFKLLVKKEEVKKFATMAEALGRAFTADMHRLYHDDARLWLPKQSAEIFDVIITDPPYGMSADEFGDSGSSSKTEHAYEDSYENFKSIMDVFCTQSYRIAKSAAHLYMFCDVENFLDLRLWLSEAGWRVFRTPMIWYKKTGFRIPWVGQGPQRKYELILYAQKGNRNVTRIASDVLEYTIDTTKAHAARKPDDLYVDLLSRSVRPGDVVCDPFCGSGPVFSAAHGLKCRAVGVEKDSASYGIAAQRIQGLKAQGELAL